MQAAERIDLMDPPAIGSPEAAVLSLVNLLAYALEIKEEQLAYWLDCYYQLRSKYEKEAAPDPTVLRREDLEPVIRDLWVETLHKGCRAEAAKRLEERKAEKNAAPTTPEAELSSFEPVDIRPSPAAAAAAFKREVKAKLEEARKRGYSIGKIVNASNGDLTENELLTILDGGRVPVEIYRILDRVMNKSCK